MKAGWIISKSHGHYIENNFHTKLCKIYTFLSKLKGNLDGYVAKLTLRLERIHIIKESVNLSTLKDKLHLLSRIQFH